MSESSIKTFGTTVTEEDVQTFFARFSGDARCPVCRNNDWALTLGPPDETSQVISLRTYGPAGEAGTNHVPVFLSVCQTCGYVRMFSTLQIATWKKELGEPKDE